MDDENIDPESLFFAVLCGIIANGSHDNWNDVYHHAKVGTQTIYALIVEDVLEEELLEAQKDLHGR